MNKSQKASYRRNEWKEFSKTVICANNNQCSDCHRTPADGIVLQVHHRYYKKGLLPWQYPISACETLCSGCHAKKHGEIPPDTGWEYLGYDDLGDLIGECERCHNEIRYEHYIYHPMWGDMTVGCNCADRLTGTTEASEHDKKLKGRVIRFERFITPSNWIQEDNRHLTNYVGFPITITKQNGKFQLTIFIPLQDKYDSLEDAQNAAFKMVEGISIEEFLKEHNLPEELYTSIPKPRAQKNPFIYKDILSFAKDNKTQRIKHIYNVSSGVRCNCSCPSCGEPVAALYKDNYTHHFAHITHNCPTYYPDMLTALALQTIIDKHNIILPEYTNEEVELKIPTRETELHDCRIIKNVLYATCKFNLKSMNLAIITDINNYAIQNFQQGYQCVKISINAFLQKHDFKLEDFKKHVLSPNSIKWVSTPLYDSIVADALKEKELEIQNNKAWIKEQIDLCIGGEKDIENCYQKLQMRTTYRYSAIQCLYDEIIDRIKNAFNNPLTEDYNYGCGVAKLIQWVANLNDKNVYERLIFLWKEYDWIRVAIDKYNHSLGRLQIFKECIYYFFAYKYHHQLMSQQILNNYYFQIKGNSRNKEEQIRDRFDRCGIFSEKHQSLKKSQSIGIEQCFIVFVYGAVAKLDKVDLVTKKQIYDKIHSPLYYPIFAAVGSLWFGHIFSFFQEDATISSKDVIEPGTLNCEKAIENVQSFISKIVQEYPSAAYWVLKYIENMDLVHWFNEHEVSLEELRIAADTTQRYDYYVGKALYYTFLENKNGSYIFPKG